MGMQARRKSRLSHQRDRRLFRKGLMRKHELPPVSWFSDRLYFSQLGSFISIRPTPMRSAASSSTRRCTSARVLTPPATITGTEAACFTALDISAK